MIRIGIVGCGRILPAHLRGYRLLREAGVDDFQVTALCSRNLDHARACLKRGAGPAPRPAVSDAPGDPLAVADEYLSDFQPEVETRVYADYRQMTAEGPIDAVNDFTSHDLHCPIALAACANGEHLLTQKPLAATLADAARMCEAYEHADLVLGVCENWRYRDTTRYVRWLVDSGRLGRLQMILLGNVGGRWAPRRVVANTPWRHQKASGGGIALDLGVHQFALIRDVAGEVRSISARTAIIEPQRELLDDRCALIEHVQCDADDTFYASFETETGVSGVLFSSWAGAGGPTVLGRGPVYYGAAGRLEGATLSLGDGTVRDVRELYQEECEPSRQARDFPYGLRDEFACAQHDWLCAIRERRSPQSSGREGLRDLACALAILESAHLQRSVSPENSITQPKS